MSLGLAILTVLLPFTAWASVFGPQVFRRLTSSYFKSGGVGGLLQHPFVLFALQVLQGIASIVIATLWSQGFMGSGQAVDCNLQTTWRGFWMAHDGRSIESIQNAFGCCGFKSVRDMAWPSPHGNVGLCSELTHRGTSCAAPWRGTLRRLSGFEFGVALGCAAIQVRKKSNKTTHSIRLITTDNFSCLVFLSRSNSVSGLPGGDREHITTERQQQCGCPRAGPRSFPGPENDWTRSRGEQPLVSHHRGPKLCGGYSGR